MLSAFLMSGLSPPTSPRASVSTVQVYTVLCAALGAERQEATAQLSAWERYASPGYFAALAVRGPAGAARDVRLTPLRPQEIACSAEAAAEQRLLALLQLKGAVGSSWRKTLATRCVLNDLWKRSPPACRAPSPADAFILAGTTTFREWLRVPEEERAFVRRAVLGLVLSAPTTAPQLAAHASLTAANIARFDAPRRWPELLPALVGAATVAGEGGCASITQLSALHALKHVFAAMAGTRAAGGSSQAAADAGAARAAAGECLRPVSCVWRAAAAPGGDARTALRAASALRPLARLLPSLRDEAVPPFLSDVLCVLRRDADPAAQPPQRLKHFRLLVEVLVALVDGNALGTYLRVGAETPSFLLPAPFFSRSLLLTLPSHAHPSRAPQGSPPSWLPLLRRRRGRCCSSPPTRWAPTPSAAPRSPASSPTPRCAATTSRPGPRRAPTRRRRCWRPTTCCAARRRRRPRRRPPRRRRAPPRAPPPSRRC